MPKVVTMKKNLSVIVLIVEIVSISLLHAIKIRQNDKTVPDNHSLRYSSSKSPIQLNKPAVYYMSSLKVK